MIHRLVRFKGSEENETIWLTIYADLITNMMLVFLALYGLTVMGDDALARAIQSMKFSELAIDAKDKLDFDSLAPELKFQFKDIPDIQVTSDVGAIHIEFGENVLFDSGRAVAKASAEEPIRVVATLLQIMPHTVIVEGHTDAVLLAPGGLYRDNNELSMARAMSVVRLLIQDGLAPAQLAAAAYGPYRPKASNGTLEGRRANRRVEIALFRDFPYGK